MVRPQRGRSSEVERQLPKLNVAGSIPAGRSKNTHEFNDFLMSISAR
jgi:hypothetical protein